MRYLVYLILSAGFFAAQAEEKKIFNPFAKKAEICQQVKELEAVLSCDPVTGQSCTPVYEDVFNSSSFLSLLQLGTSMMCSFECVVGKQMCDETLNPDNSYSGYYEDFDESPRNAGCDRSGIYNILIIERSEFRDDDGVKHVEMLTKDPETGCEEWTEYIEVCRDENNPKNCTLIAVGTEEWAAYQRELQLKKYEASCVIPTKAYCKDVEKEMKQCVLDVTKVVSELACSPSTKNLWGYRKHGLEGLGEGMVVRKKSSLPADSSKDITLSKETDSSDE